MSIADKLTTIAENEQKVYDAGKQAQRDEFWDNAQENGNRVNYDYFFAGGAFTRETAKAKYKIKPTSAMGMFERNNQSYDPIQTLEDLGVEVDFSDCKVLTSTFANSGFKYISKITSKDGSYANFGNCFYNCINLEKIGEFEVSTTSINGSSANGISFPLCTKLADIVMVGEIATFFNAGVCPLIKDSIVNIIEHLSATATGKTLTLNKSAVDSAFETAEGLADGSASAEWIAQISPKSNQYDGNWTISLL